MSIAVLTDVHGNSVALDAVVRDARATGVDRWWVLGDLVAMGPDPVGTLARLRALEPELCILGNTERYVMHDSLPFPPTAELDLTVSLVDQMVETAASFAWTKGSLGDEDRSWLARGSVRELIRLADGTGVLAVHASARRDDGPGIDPVASDDALRSLFPDIDGVGVVVGGHTHHTTDRTVDAVRFLNPGSVSNHVGGDHRAKYLVIHDDADGHRVEFRAVEYDVARVIDALAASAMPGRGFVLREYFGR